MNEISNERRNSILRIISELENLADKAESKFKSAQNWGFIDIFGGGFFTNLVKHHKIDSASSIMGKIQIRLEDLQRELNSTISSTNFEVHKGFLMIFADFAFDGFLVDIFVQSKIMSSLKQVRELKNRLAKLKNFILSS